MNILDTVVTLLQGGLGNLAAYLAAHVPLCLLPAYSSHGLDVQPCRSNHPDASRIGASRERNGK